MVDFAKPGREHDRLRRLTGAWTARIKYFPAPDAPPQESTGQYLARMDIGGYFLCREMNFGMQGYQGRGLTGYDTFKGAYVGTWVDSTSPLIYRTEGHFDERGVYCETSEGLDADGTLIRLRLTTEMLEPNQMLFQIYSLDDAGLETLTVRIEHTRRRFVD
jgi:Protein of unknown function (DUF1579)